MLRESLEDWRTRCEELTAENRELAARPDMTTFMQVLHDQQRVIDTLAQGSSDMSQQILVAIKTGADLVVEHDKRANANMDRLANLIAEREQRFRQTDR